MSDAASVPRFFAPEPLSGIGTVMLGEDAARHMRVLRMSAGAEVVLLDGQGTRAQGTLRALAKRNATVAIESVESLDAPAADRDRMLWLAEKSCELALTSWRPVQWKRSRSVTPRGEGGGFQLKVNARMASALEQSGNAWLPITYPDATPDRALASLPDGARVVLDAGGEPIASALRDVHHAALTIALGPEGGLEDTELALLVAAGFRRVSLGPMTLRFETAGIAAIAHARAALASPNGLP
jgi:16S rRNA (uracil1498-N3)-methyltransferase